MNRKRKSQTINVDITVNVVDETWRCVEKKEV